MFRYIILLIITYYKIHLLRNINVFFAIFSRPATARKIIRGTQLPPLASAVVAEAVSPGPEVESAVGGKIDHQQWRVSAGKPLSAMKRRPQAGAESLRQVASSASSTITITPCRYDKPEVFPEVYCLFAFEATAEEQTYRPKVPILEEICFVEIVKRKICKTVRISIRNFILLHF